MKNFTPGGGANAHDEEEYVDGIFRKSTPEGGPLTPAEIIVTNVLLIANPRSGSQHAAKFIDKYGAGV